MKRRLNIIEVFIVLLFPFNLNAQIYFEEESTDVGLNVVCGNSNHGNGVTFFDFNKDGWDDLTFNTDSNQAVRFFKNVNGTFEEYFFTIPDLSYETKSVNWVDYDNDGDSDIYVTSFTNGNKLLRNDGNDTFVDVTDNAGLPLDNIYTYGASWGDVNNDGHLDVFLSSFDPDKIVPNYLYLNNGNGTFSDISASAGISNVGHLSFCSAFFDYNNDGWQDIYISNDRIFNKNILYENNGDNTFTDVSEVSGTDTDIDAMTVTIGDFNSDGWFDIYVTGSPDDGNVLYKNNGDGTFTDIAAASGTLFYGTCWGSVFLDAENDMDIDLYVSSSLDGSNNFDSSKFFENLGSEFFLNAPSFGFDGDTNESHSNAIGDVDNDGFLDIIVNNRGNQNIDLWKNKSTTSNNWLKINLEGTQSNKDGIGSVIEVSINNQKQYRYTLCGEGYLSQNSATEVFGLGSNTEVDYIKVKWLSGVEDILFNVPANQVITLVEGSTLSLTEYDKDQVLIYPNPAKEVLYINSKNINIISVKVFDVFGKEVLVKTLESRSNVDISKFQSGIYFIKLVDSENNSTLVKFLKQ